MKALLIAGRDGPALQGVATDYAGTVGDAIELTKAYAFDVVLVRVPEKVVEVVRRLRAAEIRVPIMVLGRLPGPEIVKVLEVGADVFAREPFAPGELEARVRALVRRAGAQTGAPLQIGQLTIDLFQRRVEVDGRLVHLRRLELRLLEALALRQGRSVSKEELMDLMYGVGEEVSVGALNRTVSRLRQAIGASVGGSHYISTVRAHGFMLAA